MQTLGENTYYDWQAVTPSDTTPVFGRAFYVTGAGTLILRPVGSSVDLTHTAGANSIIALGLAGGTVRAASTATGIFALR